MIAAFVRKCDGRVVTAPHSALTIRAAEDSESLPWDDVRPGVARRLLEQVRQGAFRQTQIVRLSAGAEPPLALHAGGEDIYVLEGTLCLQGESYPAGTYIGLPPGDRPPVEARRGCTLFWKSRPTARRERVVVGTRSGRWDTTHTPGFWSMSLDEQIDGRTVLLRFDAGTSLGLHQHRSGEEFFVLRGAIAECYNSGLLGDDILGSGFNLQMHVHPSGGRYICGEETALINALEGKRANPRAKPPFPQVSGLWGRPTIVNNVETLCNIPHIIDRGADWFKSLGLGEDAGTKMFGASGRVNNPGCWELPMGTPIRDIVEIHAGGMQPGLQLRGFLPGGGSTDFLTADHLDLAMDYDVIGKAGSRMGTGLLVVLDDHTCPVAMVLNLIRFFAHESCGFCTPCREGLPWTRQVLEDIEQGRGRAEDLETLAYQVSYIGAMGNTHCALAPGAMEPLQSALKYFREDFERHISDGCCPYGGANKMAAHAHLTSPHLTSPNLTSPSADAKGDQ